MVLSERFVVKRYFDGHPKPEDFELVKEEQDPLQYGEIAFESEFISVDPYQRRRAFSFEKPPCTMVGSVVAKVTESRNPSFPAGCRIVAYCGWVKRGKLHPDKVPRIIGLPGVALVPDLGPGLSTSLHLGACGMTGVTAYMGLLELCRPKPGETVMVNAAAGAVGSLVGQIARISGCKAIGCAGTDDKLKWLTNELGFDKAYNYKKAKMPDVLKEVAPHGIDCFFENVGGEDSSAIMGHMNQFGRVAVCGIISSYNRLGEMEKVTSLHHPILTKELKVEGFLVGRWSGPKWNKAVLQLAAWIKSGQIKVQETVVEGFEKTPATFASLFTGVNSGKVVVKV